MGAESQLAVVRTVVDGDTVEVGNEAGSVETVRLIGINAPETGECYWDRATQELAGLAPVGGELVMIPDVSDRDRFGRLLRYLWVGDILVNEELVRAGAAIAVRYPPDTAEADRLRAAQTEAQRAGAGLWAPDACGPEAETHLVIVTIRYDPPGDDNQYLDQEWILIRNEGTETADLTGWQIRDESSIHRYAFPHRFRLAPGGEVRVVTGCGTDTGDVLHWCSRGSAVWNNDGDTGFLLDPEGNVHFSFSYSP